MFITYYMTIRTHFTTLLLSIFSLTSIALHGQTKNTAYIQYIEQYKSIAISQMRQYHIPASITMAQALLESGAGKSSLAQKSNNHFGIKVSTGWTGPYVLANDDRPNERFRKYDRVEESYEDHSKFLLKSRYAPLFQLDPLDYRGWARGLKACGYATNPSYANLLINIIDLYDLHDLDEDLFGNKSKKSNPNPVVSTSTKHQVKTISGKRYIVARPGDTWSSIAKETGLSVKKLCAYNEISPSFAIVPGTNIFLQKKAKKGDKIFKGYWHKILQGESMYDISQKYGIRLSSLYKLNFKDDTYIPIEGDLLRIR